MPTSTLARLIVVLNCACTTTSFYYEGRGGVVFDSATDFKSQVWESDAVWVVQFFTLFSQKSEMFVPEWQKSVKALSGIVKTATVDVSSHEDIAAAFGVHIHDKNFPYIKIFSANKKTPDDLVGPLKAAHVVEQAMNAALNLATDRLEGKIFQGSHDVPGDDIPVEDKASTAAEDELVSFVNDINFESLVVRSQQIWLLLFVAPGKLCLHCRELSTEFHNAAEIVKRVYPNVNGTVMLSEAHTGEIHNNSTIRFGLVDAIQSPELAGMRCSVGAGLIPALRVVMPTSSLSSEPLAGPVSSGTHARNCANESIVECRLWRHNGMREGSTSPVMEAESAAAAAAATSEPPTKSKGKASRRSESGGANSVTALDLVDFSVNTLESLGTLLPVPQLVGPEVLELHCGASIGGNGGGGGERGGSSRKRSRLGATNSMCVIVALPNILDDGGKEGRLRYLDVLRQVAKGFVARQLPVGVLWTEGGAQPKLESVTSMTYGYPAVVAVHLQKGVFAAQQGAFTVEAIDGFVGQILAGKQRTTPLQGLMRVNVVDHWDGQEGKPVVDDYPLDFDMDSE
jgi:hypothetical protein